MRTKKIQSPPSVGFTVNALSRMTGADRRTVDKVVAVNGIKPVGISDAGKQLFSLEQIEGALKVKPDKSLKDEKIAEEIRKLRLRNDKEEGKLILKSAVVTVLMKFESELAPLIERKLMREWPANVAATPDDIPRVMIFGSKLNDEIRECIKHGLVEPMQKIGL